MSLITEVDILDEAKECFLVYANETLTDRAIPAAEDGLLSSQRKILWTMEDYLKMSSKSKTKKCNGIVGSTLATAYFHGDASCYGVLCKMSQKYLMRYPLVDGQGMLGTQADNDIVASSRYTEAKPSVFADLMMEDFKKEVVPLKETYNGEFYEPVVLPGLFPNALCNGRQSIGVSMAVNTLPNNLTEVCNALIAYLKDDTITLDDILKYMPGPDFPLGGTVINIKDVREAFRTGKSKVSLKVRGDYIIQDQKIIFTTIPYRAYRNKIKQQINDNIDIFDTLIDDFDDESNIGENKLIFYVKAGLNPENVIKKIFALTDLQSSYSYNMNFIVNGTPKLCSLIDLIKAYLTHQDNILVKATEYDKAKTEARIHILEALIKAVDAIDEVIKIIKTAANTTEASIKLQAFLNIDDIQAKAILDMKLGRLTKIDKEELVNELKEKTAFLQRCIEILTYKNVRDEILIQKITSLRDKYGDTRRTKLLNLEEPKEEPYVEPEKCVVIMSESGNIKRVAANTYKVQKRNGKGIKTQDDITKVIIRTNTVDNLMVFSNKGTMYKVSVESIPEGTNSSKGTSISNLVTFNEPDEKASIIYSIYKDTDAEYILFTTKNGLVKKTALSEYENMKKKTGIAAIKLKPNDEIASVNLIKDENIIFVTKKGYCLRCDSATVSPTGRVTMGVKGITLTENDEVATTLVLRHTTDDLATFTRDGFGKRMNLIELAVQGRAGKGINCLGPKKGETNIAGAALVEDSDILLINGKTNSICINASDITKASHVAIGVKLIQNNEILKVSKV